MPCPTLTAKKVHENDIFERQVVLHFFSEESKDYEYAKSPNMRQALLKYLIFLDREFIDKAINEFAQNHPNIALYVTKRHGRHPRIVANYCKYSKSGKVLTFSL